MTTLIKDAKIVNEGIIFTGSVLIENKIISKVFTAEDTLPAADKTINAKGLYLIPGVIDDQVHFREPGNTLKADIESESAAAVLGGVTSFMDMPNNNPPACSTQALKIKFDIAENKSYSNYSFYLGASNDNIDEIVNLDPKGICGVKVFMGSSTGNMLVDNQATLEEIFSKSPILVATHCEDENTIKANHLACMEKYGEDIPFEQHPLIRSREACIKSSTKAIDLAIRHNTRLHILHISTAEEIDALKDAKKISNKISGETCVHYLKLNSLQYAELGSKMKCNPAVKDERDMFAIRKGVKESVVDVIATDHAPHQFSEKCNPYNSAPSGLPLVQHSLQVMLKLTSQGIFSLEHVVEKMCHAPATCFNISKRGFIREGYYADLCLVDYQPNNAIFTISKENIAYKCKWSPFEGETFDSKIEYTFVNGQETVSKGQLTGEKSASALEFDR